MSPLHSAKQTSSASPADLGSCVMGICGKATLFAELKSHGAPGLESAARQAFTLKVRELGHAARIPPKESGHKIYFV